MRRAIAVAALALAALVAGAPAGHTAGKVRTSDVIFTVADSSLLRIRSIAMFPVATYDHDLEVERTVTGMWGQAIRGAGFRWVSANSVRAMLPGGDSLIASMQQALLRNPRVDSLAAHGLCASLRTSAVLTLRVDRWEQRQIQWDQAGRPATTVQLHAALVDSTGRLLWSASGSETADGPEHDPSTNPIAVASGNLGSQPVTGEGGPPAYADVAQRLFVRWAARFPVAAP